VCRVRNPDINLYWYCSNKLAVLQEEAAVTDSLPAIISIARTIRDIKKVLLPLSEKNNSTWNAPLQTIEKFQEDPLAKEIFAYAILRTERSLYIKGKKRTQYQSLHNL
jgi:hypothetical protein